MERKQTYGVWVNADEKEQLENLAKESGLSVGKYLVAVALGVIKQHEKIK